MADPQANISDAQGPLPLQCAGGADAPGGAPGTPGGRPAESAQARIAHSIVRIHAYAREYNLLRPFQQTGIGKGVGSGVIIDPSLMGSMRTEGALYILTCEHVVRNSHEVMLVFPMHGREEHPARLRALCMETDLALIECMPDSRLDHTGLAPLQLGSSDDLQAGDRVRAFGFPLGQNALKVTDGVYSGYQDSFLQHSSPISKGNSGGPLLNEKHEVVGVNSSGAAQANNVGYAVPERMVRVLFRDMSVMPAPPAQQPYVVRRYSLGLHVHSTTPATLRYRGAEGCAQAGGGVQVRFIYDKSPLKEHVKDGDLIVGIDGKGIDYKGDVCVPWNRQKVDLFDYLDRKSNADALDVQVWAGGACRVVRARQAQVKVHGRRYLALPYEIDQLEYVLFAGLVVMPLRANHEEFFPVVFAELGLERSQRPHLVLTDVIPGTMAYKAEVLRPGKLVKRVNGHPVSTMEELRAALRRPVRRRGGWYFTLQTHKNRRVVFPLPDIIDEQVAKTRGPHALWPADLPQNTGVFRDMLAHVRQQQSSNNTPSSGASILSSPEGIDIAP